jgi:hypothetical protein
MVPPVAVTPLIVIDVAPPAPPPIKVILNRDDVVIVVGEVQFNYLKEIIKLNY